MRAFPPVRSARGGTVSVAGSVVSFTPSAGYIGPASFTYTATNPGGMSAPATVSVTVAPPPAPVTGNRRVRVSATAPTTFDLAPDITGLYTSVAVAQQPIPGSVALAGTMATYTPRSGFTGETTFKYTATGPGGTSTPGTVTLVYTASPVTSNRTLVVRYNTSGTIDLTSAFAGDHRNALVAADFIVGLEKDAARQCVGVLGGIDERLGVSRRHQPEVRARLKA